MPQMEHPDQDGGRETLIFRREVVFGLTRVPTCCQCVLSHVLPTLPREGWAARCSRRPEHLSFLSIRVRWVRCRKLHQSRSQKLIHRTRGGVRCRHAIMEDCRSTQVDRGLLCALGVHIAGSAMMTSLCVVTWGKDWPVLQFNSHKGTHTHS